MSKSGDPNNDASPVLAATQYLRDELTIAHGQIAALRQQLDRRVNGSVPVDRYELHWIGDAMQPQEELPFVIQEVFLEGSMNQVVGKPGSKKTYLMLDALIAVATGDTWLGKTTRQGPTLFVDEESGRRRLERRIAALAKARKAPADTPLAYVSLAQFNLRTAEDVQALRQLAEETGAVLVVIDAMADIMPGADENSVKDVQPVLMALRKLAEETRAAVVLIHHSGKNGEYRGSTAILGAVDLMLKVEAKAGGIVKLTSEKARDVDSFSLSGYVKFGNDEILVAPAFLEPDETDEPRMSAGEEYVMRFLNKHGASTIKEMKQHVDTCSARTAENGVYSLARKGKIERVDGRGPGSEATYDIHRDRPPIEGRLPYKDDP